MDLYGVSVRGLLVALIGFALTRFTVTLAATETTREFLFTGLIPLVVGLSLTAFGVVLAVGTYDELLLQKTLRWCLLGTGSMSILVVVTVVGAEPDVLTDPTVVREQTYLSNFLIGGSVGGALTGLYAARAARQRETLTQQTNRLVVLNRLLRDKVINSAMAIKGHADVLQDGLNDDSVDVVGRQADSIVQVIENVKYLSETADTDDISLGPVDVGNCVESELDTLESLNSDVDCSFDGPDEPVEVRANSQLAEVFRHLFENAVKYSDTETPRLAVSIEASRTTATVHVRDNGPGLSDEQQALLERGEIAEYDDPTTGFGMNIVRLLVEGFDGRIETSVDEDGTTVSVQLPRAAGDASEGESTTPTPGVSPAETALAVPVGLAAGLTMAAAMVFVGFDLQEVSALYGIENIVVAMITHEFHSVVFALLYAAVLVILPQAYGRRPAPRLGIGIVFGLGLWVVAAGLVMPVWLRLVGIDAPLPNVPLASLVGHIVWGATTASLFQISDRFLSTER